MKPSDPMRANGYSTPGEVLVDSTGYHLRTQEDIFRATTLERRDGALSSDLSYTRLALQRLGVTLPDRVMALFYFPWATGTTTAQGDFGRHYKLQQVLKRSLNQAAVAELQPYIKKLALRMLAREIMQHGTATNGQTATINLAEYANKLAFHVISELAGLPYTQEAEEFMLQHLHNIATREGFLEAFEPESPDVRVYILNLLQGEKPRPDCLLEYVAQELNNREISEDEAVGLILGTWAAGRETTSTLISLIFGLVHEAGKSLEAANFALINKSLRTSYIQEALRFTPFPASTRVATADIEIGGVPIPRLSLVHLRWEAANRDPEVYGPNAHLFVPGREAQRSLAFGHGMHYCLGEQLATTEAHAAMATVYGLLGEFKIIDWRRKAGLGDVVTHAVAEYDLYRAQYLLQATNP